MKIFCIGRNYADHAKELNNEVPAEPVLFMKPPTALIKGKQPFYYPEFSKDIHYEGELVLKICKNGKHIAEKFAHKYYEEITFGIDFTARDVQKRLKEKGLPWEIAKGFDGAAAIGEFTSVDFTNPIQLETHKNGAVVQQGTTGDMIFSFNNLITYISSYFTLQKGDLIFTGTPAGVGPVKIGDRLEGYVNGRKLLECHIK